jgi:hypothetical protein
MDDLGPRITKVLNSLSVEYIPGFVYTVKVQPYSYDTVFVSADYGKTWRYATTVHDIIGWNDRQIVGHICTVLERPTPTVVIQKEKELMDLDKISKQGEDDATMWVALVRSDIPFMLLRRFATFCASTRGIQTMEAGNAYTDAFMQVFVDYQNANKLKEI